MATDISKNMRQCVYKDILPSHHTLDRKYFLDWWVTLGKEDITVYRSKTRETKGSLDIRAEDTTGKHY